MSFKHKNLTMRKQQGFSLAELSVTTVITTIIIIGGIQMQAYQATQEAAQSIAQMYQRINRAAESYMANYYGQIKTLPAACSNVGWGGSTMGVGSLPPGPPASGCGVTLGAVAVLNGLQPTLDELDRLGLLARAGGSIFTNQLPMPTFATAAGNPLQMVNSGGAAAPAHYAVLIRQVPIQGGGTDLQSLVYNLQPYNLTNSSRATDTLLDMIIVAAGGDALLADNLPGTSGQLRGQAGASGGNSVNNPLQVKLNGTVQGAPYILAMRGGFGSSGYDQFVRRDGTQTLTAAWNVGNQDITGVNNLGAVNGTFTGDISARDISGRNGTLSGNLGVTGDISGRDISGRNGTLSGNLGVTGDISGRDIAGRNGTLSGNLGVTGDISGRDISGRNGTLSGNLGVTGDLSANKGTFSGLLSGVSATFSGALEAASAKINGLLEAASAKIAGALEVVGNAVLGSLQVRGATTLEGSLGVTGATTLTGSLTANGTNLLNGQTTAQQFRLGAGASLGGACDPSRETVARFVENSSPITPYQPKIMVCDPNTNKWTYAVNFSDEITGLNTSVTNLGNTLTNTNSNLASVSGAIGTINNNISTINTNIAKLDDRVTNLEDGLRTVSGSVSTLQTGYSSLTNSVGSLQTDVAGLKKYPLKWDIINVQWDRWVNGVGSKVWKKTPWKCDPLGNLKSTTEDGVRWLQDASNNQVSGTYTVPMLVGLDSAPRDDTVVYDFNCVSPTEASDGGVRLDASYWYVGMSSVLANLKGGNSCRQGLSTNTDPSKKNYLMDRPAEVNYVDGPILSGILVQVYPTVTIRLTDGAYKTKIDLPGGGYPNKKVSFENYASNSVTITGAKGGDYILPAGPSSQLFIHDGKDWNPVGPAPDYNPYCSGSGSKAAPTDLTGWNKEAMAARFIAFTRMP